MIYFPDRCIVSTALCVLIVSIPNLQLKVLDNDNSINDLQSNEINNKKKVINSSDNSNTPIQLTSNDNKYILNDNRKSNSIKNVPTYQL